MIVSVHTPTPDRAASAEFYQRLGFECIDSGERVFADSQVRIEIQPDRYARPGLRLYGANWEDKVGHLRQLTHIYKAGNDLLLNDGTGCWIYLTPDAPPEAQSVETRAIIGNFAGLSLEAHDLDRTVEIWRLLGFEGGQP